MIPEMIKARRLELGYTTTELAKIVGVGQTTISSWERGAKKPGQLNLVKLARALEWSEQVRFQVLKMNEDKDGGRVKLTDEFYDLLHELEHEFESMDFVPEDDERLFKLRMMVGGDAKASQGFDKKKVDRARAMHRISRHDLSVSLGYSPGWFSASFLNGGAFFTRKQAMMFAEFFDMKVEDFKYDK